MGLFVAEDGHYQGWLAAFLCCCAAVDVDEHPIERMKSRPSTAVGACNEQPLPLTALPAMPTARQMQRTFKGDEPIIYDYNLRKKSQIPDHPPAIGPLELGNSSLLDRPFKPVKRKNSLDHPKRPIISAPSSFRRLDYTDGQRAGLIPLKLGPVVLKDTPTPTTMPSTTLMHSPPEPVLKRSDSTEGLLTESDQERYHAQHDSPYQRYVQRNSESNLHQISRPGSRSSTTACSRISHGSERPGSRAPVSTQTSYGSLRRQALETNASMGASRTSSERTRLQKKRSLQNVRRPYAESGEVDMDKEVLELNTIVEERRAEARRSNPPKQHIAAIAPAMQVNARSETLRDIGSGLARPFTARDSTRVDPIFDRPERTSRPATARAGSRSSSRVSGWLSGLVSSSTTQTPQNHEPFYKCTPTPRPRTQSETSFGSSGTMLESPSLTTASSPTSKAHSRSLTAESRITPLSPMPTIYSQDYADIKEVDEWPMMTMPRSQVGLAI